jgi:hypothetical protein
MYQSGTAYHGFWEKVTIRKHINFDVQHPEICQLTLATAAFG